MPATLNPTNTRRASLLVQAVSRLLVLAVLGMLVVYESSWGGLVSWQLWGGFVAGAALQAPGGYLLRRAVFMFPRPEIVALHYLEPGLAVLWLWLSRGIDVARPGLWAAGLVSVIVANIFICVSHPPDGLPASAGASGAGGRAERCLA